MIDTWLTYLLVDGIVVAAGAVGLSLHLRLVRFFDMTWAAWVMTSALFGFYAARWSSRPTVGIVVGGAIGAVFAILEYSCFLRRVIGGAIPRELLERVSFSGALAAYLVLTSAADAMGFRDQKVLPPTAESASGLSPVAISAIVACCIALLFAAWLRTSRLGIKLRALLDDSTVSLHYGLDVEALSLVVGALAGSLTGLAGASFGLLYTANRSVGLSFMVLAAVPCIIAGMQSSVRVVMASGLFVGCIAWVKLLLGDSVSECVVFGSVVLLLLFRPVGVLGQRTREV